MKAVLLIDFGSTYTKICAVDVESKKLLGTAAAHTTVKTDINEGLEKAKKNLFEKTGELEFSEYFACSSAAGGLKMVTLGLVPELTAKAAKLASLGAGAKISKVFAFQITEDDLLEIEEAAPDIVLLTGGIDGGNTECILHNARMLARAQGDFPIVVAGNRGAANEIKAILKHKRAIFTENVMPRFNVLNITPAQEKIREIFLERIISAKGLSKAKELTQSIVMPTPSALLEAILLLANGHGEDKGIGELMAVDIGGATTDIYSIADGLPSNNSIILKGLVEPKIKRSVEGDIGMRYSAKGIADAEGIAMVAKLAGLTEEHTTELLGEVSGNPELLPTTDDLQKLDFALSALAAKIGSERHSGELEEVYTPLGKAYAQTGKDLTGVKWVVITGGSVIHSSRAVEIARFAMACDHEPMKLKPRNAKVLVDREYILAGMGLLAEKYPAAALSIMREKLESQEI